MPDSQTDIAVDWPERYCSRCDTTLRAPTWRRLATMNGRHHMIKKGHLFTRCMELRVQRRADRRDAEHAALLDAILDAPKVTQDGVAMYEIVGPPHPWADPGSNPAADIRAMQRIDKERG